MRSRGISQEYRLKGFLRPRITILIGIAAISLMTSCDKKLRHDQTSPPKTVETEETKVSPAEAYWKSLLNEPLETRKGRRGNTSQSELSIPVRFTISDEPTINNEIGVSRLPREPSLAKLPHWKRESIRLLREQKAEILRAGKAEGEAIQGATPQERNKWLIEWSRRNRDHLVRIDTEEMQIIAKRLPDASSPERMRELIEKIETDKPVFDESDVVPLEQLLPPDNELGRPEIVQNGRIEELLLIHSILAKRYPRSVTRPGISKFYHH